jgi:hypothetical protein
MKLITVVKAPTVQEYIMIETAALLVSLLILCIKCIQ